MHGTKQEYYYNHRDRKTNNMVQVNSNDVNKVERYCAVSKSMQNSIQIIVLVKCELTGEYEPYFFVTQVAYGYKAAIYTMEKMFKEVSTETVLLVDAVNASNSINRNVFFHNVSILCPAISTFITNSCAIPARLFATGGTEIRYNERTAQEDPAAKTIYALSITPIIIMMIELVTTKCDDIKMVTFANDFSTAEK